MDPDLVLPAGMYDVGAERAVLGACLKGGRDLIEDIRTQLPPDAFYTAQNVTVWRAVTSLMDDGVEVDVLSVPQRIMQHGGFSKDDPGLHVYVDNLHEYSFSFRDIAQHVKTIVEYARVRRFHAAGLRMTQLAASAGERLQSGLLDTLENLVSGVREDIDDLGERPNALPSLRASLLDSKQLDHIPPLTPIIDNTIMRNTLAWVIGAPSAGKSLVALDMAGAVGTGGVWQGQRAHEADVLYVVGEGAPGMLPRVRAWEGSAGHLMDNVYFLPIAVQVALPSEWKALVDLAAEMLPGLIIIDTQAMSTVGMDENSPLDMGRYVNACQMLRIASGACVMSVHHLGRFGEHMRGHSSLDGVAQTIIRVADEDGRYTVVCEKQKDGEKFPELTLRLAQSGSSVVLTETTDEEEDAHEEDAVQSRAMRKTLKDWWTTYGNEWVSASKLVSTDVLPKSTRTFERSRWALRNAGILEQEGKARSVQYRLSGAALVAQGIIRERERVARETDGGDDDA